jgi:hypothetical protein
MTNPPTLLLAIEKLTRHMIPEDVDAPLGKWVKRILPKLKEWVFWFQETQINESGFPMWKGR